MISKTVQSLPKTPQRLRICHRWRKTGYIGYRRTLQHWRYVSIIVVIWTYFHCGKRAAVPIHMHHGHRRRSSWNSEGDAWWAPKVGRCRMGWVWEGRPLSSQLRGLRERCELPQWGPDFGVFWRPQNAPVCTYVTKIWGGQFALASPYSKFWEGDMSPASPHDLRPYKEDILAPGNSKPKTTLHTYELSVWLHLLATIASVTWTRNQTTAEIGCLKYVCA